MNYTYIGGQPGNFKAKERKGERFVMLATPTTRAFPTAYVHSMIATVEMLARAGARFIVHVFEGECHVDDARNVIVRDFLKSDCTDLFFIDSDMGWDAPNVLKLIDAEGDIVGGVYCKKLDNESYTFQPFEGKEVYAGDDGLWDVPKLPTGFMRIRRHVLEALHKQESAKGRAHFLVDNSDTLMVATIFERGYASELGVTPEFAGTNSDRHSGDIFFCLKARKLGFNCRADIEQHFTHVGDKEWKGHLGNKMRRDQNVDHPLFVEAVNALKSGVRTPAVFDRINAHSSNPAFALPGAALMECARIARHAQGNILELGSGLSTLVMGLELAGTDKELHAFECDLAWFKATSVMLERHGVKNVVLHYLPIMPYDGFDWYGLPEVLPTFDVVLIDGPERKVCRRDTAFKMIPEILEDARVWVIDDMGDPNQRDMLAEQGAGRLVTHGHGWSAGSLHQFVIAEKAEAKAEAA